MLRGKAFADIMYSPPLRLIYQTEYGNLMSSLRKPWESLDKRINDTLPSAEELKQQLRDLDDPQITDLDDILTASRPAAAP